jgi:membrane-bound metal-dependent hydrolase YbcI (DUF457 family)
MAPHLRDVIGRSHLLVGAAGALSVGQPLLALSTRRPLTNSELVAATVICAGAAMVPDLDHPMATVSRSLGPVTWFLSRVVSRLAGGHRKGTHSLLFAVGLTVGLSALIRAVPGPVVPLCLAFFLSSLAVRTLTEADGAICAALSAAVATVIVMATRADYGWLAPAIGLGLILHDVADVLTIEGVALFWPLSSKNVRLPLVGTTGGGRERVVAGLCGLLACWLYASSVVIPALSR